MATEKQINAALSALGDISVLSQQDIREYMSVAIDEAELAAWEPIETVPFTRRGDGMTPVIVASDMYTGYWAEAVYFEAPGPRTTKIHAFTLQGEKVEKGDMKFWRPMPEVPKCHWPEINLSSCQSLCPSSSECRRHADSGVPKDEDDIYERFSPDGLYSCHDFWPIGCNFPENYPGKITP